MGGLEAGARKRHGLPYSGISAGPHGPNVQKSVVPGPSLAPHAEHRLGIQPSASFIVRLQRNREPSWRLHTVQTFRSRMKWRLIARSLIQGLLLGSVFSSTQSHWCSRPSWPPHHRARSLRLRWRGRHSPFSMHWRCLSIAKLLAAFISQRNARLHRTDDKRRVVHASGLKRAAKLREPPFQPFLLFSEGGDLSSKAPALSAACAVLALSFSAHALRLLPRSLCRRAGSYSASSHTRPVERPRRLLAVFCSQAKQADGPRPRKATNTRP